MNPLHVPLAILPGPVPEGAPGIVMVGDRAHPALLYRVECVGPFIIGKMVDLTPPPLDAQGWPTRVDALPIVVGMIARAMGHSEGQHTFMPSSTPGAWNLRTFIDGPVRRMSSTFRPDGLGATTTDETYQNFPPAPGLTSINPTNPLADRLAAVAVLNAKPWEQT